MVPVSTDKKRRGDRSKGVFGGPVKPDTLAEGPDLGL
jgi:hypothetical protein